MKSKIRKTLGIALAQMAICLPVLAQSTANDNIKAADNVKNNITEVVFIMDKSGSMHGLEADTIGGFNSLIEKQKQTEGKVLISAVLFNQDVNTIYDRIALDKIKTMTDKEYYVGGSTALLDAVGDTINHITAMQKSADKSDCPDKTLIVIMTDGMENSSKEYSYTKIKQMIAAKKELNNWEFLFLGANIDAPQEASRFGISPKRAVKYHNDSKGVKKNFDVVSEAVTAYRSQNTISDNWSQEIAADYKKRGN